MNRLFLLLLSCFLTTAAIAQDDDGYYYRTWNTEAHLSADNTMTVVERLGVHFLERSHGIFRYIHREFGALRNNAPDGQPLDVKYHIYIPEIEVKYADGAEVQITESDENNCLVVRWGSIGQWVNGLQNYTLEYTYQTPDDRIEARDYLFHTLVPEDVSSRIEHFHFNITIERPLPKDIEQRLKIYSGRQFSETLASVSNLVVTTNSISGDIYNIPAFHAVTFYAELPEGYYSDTLQAPTLIGWIAYVITMLLGIVIIAMQIFRRGQHVTRTVEFYPPQGITPIMVGTIIDGSTDAIDIAAMVPWLAHEGYITIKEIEVRKDETDLELRLVKPLDDDAPEYLKRIIRALFRKGEIQLMSKMGDRHGEINRVEKEVEKCFSDNRKLTEARHGRWMLALIACSMVTIMLSPAFAFTWSNYFFASLLWGVCFLVSWLSRRYDAVNDLFRRTGTHIQSFILRLVCFVGMCVGIFFILGETLDFQFRLPYIIVFVVVCYAACELSGRFVYNTPYRMELAGKLLGLRDFIETAEEDRLKMLVERDPQYFYQILPYAMVFGLTQKWSDLFAKSPELHTDAAQWYHTRNTSQFMGSRLSQMTSNMKSHIQTSSYDHSSHSSGHGGGHSYSSSSSHSRSSGRGYSGGGGGSGGSRRW